jgi:hypothetical protein
MGIIQGKWDKGWVPDHAADMIRSINPNVSAF